MDNSKQYKFKFHYNSKEALEERLFKLSYFHKKTTEEVFKYSCKYENNIASIEIEDDGLFVHNFSGKGWVFFNLENMILQNYDKLRVFNITDNIPYVFEKFDLTKKWLDLNLLTKEELEEEDATNSTCRWGMNKIHLKYIKRWLKDKKHLDNIEFDFILPYLQQITFFIRTIPLTNKQLETLERLKEENQDIKNALLYRKVLSKKLTQKLIAEVLENNEVITIKALINQTNKEDILEYILKKNQLNSDKVNNIIRKKLGQKKRYTNKAKKSRDVLASARLHILLAKESSVAVIIRRKPSKTACTILWDRKDDTFKVGDCVTKIVAHFCDLSPDGKSLFYYAGIQDSYWTAICKTPILRDKLVHFDNTSYGGNFIDNEQFQLHDPRGYRFYRDDFINSSTFSLKHSVIKGEGNDYNKSYISRLVRDGWRVVNVEYEKEENVQTTLHKEISKSNYVLEKTIFLHKEEYKIVTQNSLIECSDWDWAEYDKNELLFTKKGCLYRLKDIPNIEKAELIKDLNHFNVQFNKQPFTLKGSQNLQRGKYARDKEALKKAIEEGQYDAYIYLANYSEDKTFDEQNRLYRTGIEKLKEHHLLAYWHCDSYGKFLFSHEKFEEALSHYLMALNVTKSHDAKANTYLYLTVLTAYHKDFRASKSYELKAKKFFRNDRKDYAYQLATKYSVIKDYQSAYEYYILDIKNNQKDAIKGYGREERYDGLEEVSAKLNKKLLPVYLSLLEKFPNDKFLQRRLPLLYIEANQVDKAYELLEKVLDESQNKYLKERIHFSFAKKLFKCEKYEFSFKIFFELLNYNRDFSKAEYLNYMGVIYCKKELYKKAKIYFYKAMKLDDYEDLYKNNYKLIREQIEKDG